MTKAFRFGVVSAGRQSGADWIALAQQIETLGYSSLLMPDRIVTPFAPLTALATAAAVTTTLRVGAYVFCNGYRNPAVLAKEIATLDMLSNGRVEFGIGAGVNTSDFEQLGIPFGSAGDRVTQVEEAIQISKQFFSGAVNFTGKHYHVSNVPGMPRIVQRPHPPIMVGSAGRRMLTIAAREATIIAPTTKWGEPKTDELMLEKIGWIREAAGERFSEIELSQSDFGIVITDNPASVSKLQGGPPAEEQPMSTEQAVEYFEQKRAKLGISYIQVQEGQIENFAPVVQRLSGK